MPQRKYFSEELLGAGVAGATVIMRGMRPGAGAEIHYQSISVENRTSAASSAQIGRENAGTFRPRAGFVSMVADSVQNYSAAELVVRGEDVLRVDWTGTTAGDDLHVVAEGYIWSLD